MADHNHTCNRAVWFDIPVADLDRANSFYAGVLDIDVSTETFGDITFSILEHSDGNGGCLVTRPEEIAPDTGILLYLNVNGQIKDAMTKVEPLGGTIVESTHPIGPHGFRSIIRDSEGNRVVLHSITDA